MLRKVIMDMIKKRERINKRDLKSRLMTLGIRNGKTERIERKEIRRENKERIEKRKEISKKLRMKGMILKSMILMMKSSNGMIITMILTIKLRTTKTLITNSEEIIKFPRKTMPMDLKLITLNLLALS
jgi:hypothetical protein